MPDEFTEVTSQSIFGRLGDAIKGVLVGIILIPVAVVLLFWNEGRAVKTASSLKEGAAVVVSVANDSVAPANEGKLIHLSGDAKTADTINDPLFAVRANALRLSRNVEMYQWKEEEKSETQKKLGGGTETTKTYSYTKTWSNQLIESDKFKHPEDHRNPAAMIASRNTVIAPDVAMGAFKIPSDLVAKMQGDQALPVAQGDIDKLPADLKSKAKLSGGIFYFGNDPAAPAIGDQKVSLSVLKSGPFSILARQTGSALGPYPTKAGREIERVESGLVDAGSMFRHAQAENSMLTWLLRLGGLILMWIGFGLILRPLVTVADIIPLLGSLIGAGAGLASLVISLTGSITVIAIAWFAVRPILAGALVVLAVGCLILGHRLSKASPGKPA